MKTKKIFILTAAVIIFTLLSGCSAAAMRSNSWPGLSADAETAYLANGGIVYAINLKNGGVEWQYPAEKADAKESYFTDPILTDDGQLLLASAGANHSLISVNPANGHLNWSFSDAEGIWVASPLILDEIIYAPNADGKIYAFELSGSFLWAKYISDNALWAQPVSDGEFLYITSLDHHVYAFDISAKKVAWDINLNGAIPGQATLDENGILYVGALDATMTAIDSKSQKILWSAPLNGWVWDAAVVENNILYVGDLEGYIYALNTEDGSEVWTPVQPDGPITGSPLVTEDLIVVGTESGSVYSFDKEGNSVWDKSINGKLYTNPTLGSELILFSPMENENNIALVAFDFDGKQVWSFTPEK